MHDFAQYLFGRKILANLTRTNGEGKSWLRSTSPVHVPGMMNPNTRAILEPEFSMVNHSCLSKSHTKFRLQDPPCVRVLHAGTCSW